MGFYDRNVGATNRLRLGEDVHTCPTIFYEPLNNKSLPHILFDQNHFQPNQPSLFQWKKITFAVCTCRLRTQYSNFPTMALFNKVDMQMMYYFRQRLRIPPIFSIGFQHKLHRHSQFLLSSQQLAQQGIFILTRWHHEQIRGW